MTEIEVSVLDLWKKRRNAYSLSGKTCNSFRGRPRHGRSENTGDTARRIQEKGDE